MTLPIVERARVAFERKPDLLALVDGAVTETFGLLPPEVKTLCAVLLADGNLLEAEQIAGIKTGSFKMALDNLVARKMVTVEGGKVDVSPLQQQLRVEADTEAEVEEDIPAPKIVFRSLREQVVALATSNTNPAAGLGRAYAFVFGKRGNFPLLGRYAKVLGVRRAALFFLEHACDNLDGDPLLALLPLATSLGQAYQQGGYRPEDAPDLAEQRREVLAADEESWKARMRRWLNEGTLEHNLANIDQAEELSKQGLCKPPLSPAQAAADRRQVRLDFDRWEKAGRPQIGD